MKLTLRVLMVAAALAMAASVASAATNATPRVDRCEVRQHARIAQGVRSGQLTRAEARRLRAGQRHIHRVERRAKVDGKVTRAERRHLKAAQNRQGRAIYRLRHNRRAR